ncbi:proline-rich protein 11 [Rhineura floridana]|uniref:proline-rich protein 11 n=1 Tax=Rhineura floridana TaxID=261503 RepID=UPI002AC82FE0|nr:proline-rich protein 11 [Rhineura floridana]
MAKDSQQRRKLRARTKFLVKRKKDVVQAQRSSALLPKSPGPSCSRSGLFCSWPSVFLSVTEALKPLLTAALYLYWWCQERVAQISQVVKNAVFLSHARLQELDALRGRLEKLETEFARLQSVVQCGTVASSLDKPPCQTRVELAVPAHAQLGLLASGPSQPLVPPAPPPPPPLPPPQLPPAPLCLKRTDGANTQAASLKKDVPMQITIQDLLKVKLKKAQSAVGIDKRRSPFERCKVLITLSDLQSINLKSKATQPQARATNHLITPSRSGLDFRKHLKKVAVERSPGGTPLSNKENKETGAGLTPIMIQALRRKFQLAHPKSPSPSLLPKGSSFEEPS